tara:strand:+ start:2319 stop:2744 length:426 start_codon:yes stop_codon:yes gene_type:complete
MSEIAKGKCLCGRVKYNVKINEEPVYAGLCHCKDCQRYTGTAFASSLMVLKTDIEISGDLKFYGKVTDRGTIMKRGFCPNCGSNVLCKSEGWKKFYVLSAGTLDEPEVYKPSVNIYTRNAQPHALAAGDLRQFEGPMERQK